MREIKFRVYDKKMGKNVTFVSLTQNLIGFHIEVKRVLDGKETIEIVASDKDLVFALYTGLKDMRDKEIYEGDIVIVHHSDGDLTGIIKFGRGMFYIDCLPQEDHLFSNCIFTFDMIDTMDIEVIGNIYEHKHLLEDR